ncbi:MAG TPA: hypothetical protein VED59_09435, partial [Acidimicrobiales bacterium]|nr:hypothetical protein [Acidimicrobiales bacterium]
ATPDGKGYWLFTAGGGVYNYGDARLFGSPTGTHLSYPIIGASVTPDGRGYYLLSRDGTVVSYGDAVYLGSARATMLKGTAAAITEDGMSITPAELVPANNAALQAPSLRATLQGACRGPLQPAKLGACRQR